MGEDCSLELVWCGRPHLFRCVSFDGTFVVVVVSRLTENHKGSHVFRELSIQATTHADV